MQVTLATLEKFPAELEQHSAAFPAQFVRWAPPSWDGVPSEPFTAIEQICHVRDIEIEIEGDGLVHFLCSHDQQHLSGLQWLLGKIDAAGPHA